ncbi:sensor histidine kinase [Pedobacter duraquae]|uniref:Histidine kinase n=1 Tax=Pedobacter duraquae TaxID=425511 RepID=A0A4R6IQW7_9SPHI|nr:histidine kinase [Pedobacter duraquae]TDO24713.1 histidine kinase [Pedobacter duraquae]
MLHETDQVIREKKEILGVIAPYRIHLICWSLFISYEIIMVGLINERFNAAPYYLAFYTLNITLFYSFAHKILPFALKNKHYISVLLPLGLLFTFCLYYGVTLFLDALLRASKDEPKAFDLPYIYATVIRSLYRFLLFIGFSTGYYYLVTFLEERERVEEKEKEKLVAEIQKQHIQNELVKSQNALLKAQINPHFLFNTLNFIFTSSRKGAPEAAEAILSLSEIMRFSIDSGNNQTESDILLELEQVNNLIHLHRLRLGSPFFIDLEYSVAELTEVKIIPLIVITLVENIFKHGDLEQPERPGKIQISRDNGILQIVTENYRHNRATISHNIGLQNLRMRLDMAYGERSHFNVITTDSQIFKTVLTIG